MSSGTTTYLAGVSGASATDVYAVGSNGVILHYDGNAWTTMNSGTTRNLNAVGGFVGGTAIAAGEASTMAVGSGGSIAPTMAFRAGASLAMPVDPRAAFAQSSASTASLSSSAKRHPLSLERNYSRR
jgi:hypothetical protein